MEFQVIKKEQFDLIRELALNDNLALELYSTMCRFNCLVSIKKAGSGHLGSSFSAMDIIVYLYLRELNILNVGINSKERDIYFSSKGHDVPGLYSLLASLGVLEDSEILKLRRLGGLDGHPESRINGIEANTGSLGMGISKGKGVAWSKKKLGLGGEVFVLTGDGEFQEGQIWESLQTTSHQKITNITVIVDRNRYQTDLEVSNIIDIENLVQKVKSFGWHVEIMDGHDFAEMYEVFKKIKNIKDKPKLIIANTIKGKGISFLESITKNSKGQNFYNWHSGAPDNDHFNKGIFELSQRIAMLASQIKSAKVMVPINQLDQQKKAFKDNKEYVVKVYGECLNNFAAKKTDFIVLDADLSEDCKVREFERNYPDRFIENGIAEQDMVSMAGGIASQGLIPIVNSFGCFLISRANEQIYNNATEKNKIIYVSHFAGLLPAGPGKSHQSVRDISLLQAIPNIIVLQPCCALEVKMTLEYCLFTANESSMIRLVIGPSPGVINLPKDYKFEYGKGTTLVDGDDGILFSYGPNMLHEALLAHQLLMNEGFSLKIINMPWLNRIDEKWLTENIIDFDNIYILDDHSVKGGLGEHIVNTIVRGGNFDKKNIKIFGIEEYPECGTPLEVLKYHKLDAQSLAFSILPGKDYTKPLGKDYSNEAPQ